MKEIRLYRKDSIKEAFEAGRRFERGNPQIWKHVFEAGERRGSGFLNEAINAPNYLQYIDQYNKDRSVGFDSWFRQNNKRLSILVGEETMVSSAESIATKRALGKKIITLDVIEESVVEMYDIGILDLRYSKRRKHEIIKPRQIAIYLAYFHCKTPLRIIGDRWGGRDHAGVINNARTFSNHAAFPGKERSNLEKIYMDLLEKGYAIHLFVQDDERGPRGAIDRISIQPVEIDL